MAKRVKASYLDRAISKVLKDYASEVGTTIDEAGRTIAKAGAKMVGESAASKFGGAGKYASSWTVTTDKKRTGNNNIIHSTLPGLPHLLEHGHASRWGGRVEGRVHIAPVEEELIEKYQKEVIDAIQGR